MNRLKMILTAIVITLVAVLAAVVIIVYKAAPFALLVMVCAKLFYPQYPLGWAPTIIIPCAAWLGTFLLVFVIQLLDAARK